MLRYKTSLNKCKGPKIIQNCFNGIKLQMNKKKISEKYSDIWKLKTLPNNPWVKAEITTKIRKYFN